MKGLCHNSNEFYHHSPLFGNYFSFINDALISCDEWNAPGCHLLCEIHWVSCDPTVLPLSMYDFTNLYSLGLFRMRFLFWSFLPNFRWTKERGMKGVNFGFHHRIAWRSIDANEPGYQFRITSCPHHAIPQYWVQYGGKTANTSVTSTSFSLNRTGST